MQKEFVKELSDRTRFFVRSGEIDNSLDLSKPAYTDDGRPLRFLDYSDEPSGKMAVFEGSPEYPSHVKRIEVAPTLITEMFESVLDAEIPGGYIGREFYGSLPDAVSNNFDSLGLNDYSSIITKFDNAKKSNDIPGMARQIQRLLEFTKKWAPISSLPALLVETKIDAGKKEEVKKDEPEKPGIGSFLSNKWLWGGVAALVAGLVVFSGKSNPPEPVEYEEEEY